MSLLNGDYFLLLFCFFVVLFFVLYSHLINWSKKNATKIFCFLWAYHCQNRWQYVLILWPEAASRSIRKDHDAEVIYKSRLMYYLFSAQLPSMSFCPSPRVHPWQEVLLYMYLSVSCPNCCSMQNRKCDGIYPYGSRPLTLWNQAMGHVIWETAMAIIIILTCTSMSGAPVSVNNR